MQTVFVSGASGFVGRHVVVRLLQSGHRVRALSRAEAGKRRLRAAIDPEFAEAIEFRLGDVTRPSTLEPAMAGSDAIVHLVAIPRDWNRGKDMRRINTAGTGAMLDAARAGGIRRFVHLGALSVTDDPRMRYASSKARGERLVAESGLEWTILKPSVMWGDGDGFFSLLAGLVRMSPAVVPVPGDGNARFQPLAVDDLANMVALSLERPETIGRTYELGGPRVWTYREIVAEVLAALGARRIVVGVPVPLIRLVAGTAERLRLPFPVSTDQLEQLRLDNVGPLEGVAREFGFQPRPMEGELGYLRARRPKTPEPAA